MEYKIIKNSFDEEFLQDFVAVDYQLQSSVDVIKSNYNDVINSKDAYYVIIGTDSGLLYQYFKNLKKEAGFKVLFFEFKEVVNELGLAGEVGWVNESLGLFVIEDSFSFYDNIPEKYIMLDLVKIRKTLEKNSKSIQEMYDEFYISFKSSLTVYASSLHVGTRKKDFENQAIVNMAYNLVPASFLKNKFPKKAAVILGGGPSLDENINWVKENRSFLYIFAVGRIANRLVSEGIVPDFIGSIDPYEISFKNAKSFLQFADQTQFKQTPVLINAYHVNNDLLSQWGGRSVYLGPKSELFNENNISLYGPTVSHALVGAAVEFGFEDIYFVGIDLCYSDGITHEQMSDEIQAEKLVVSKKDGFWLTDNLGRKASTNRNFYKGHEVLSQIVEFYLSLNPHLSFITLGSGSAAINGVRYINSTQVFLKNIDKQDPNILFSDNQLESLSDELRSIKSLATSALKKYKKYSESSKKAISKYKDKYKLKNYFFSKEDVSDLSRLHESLKAGIGSDLDYITALDAGQFKGVLEAQSDLKSLESQVNAYISWFQAILNNTSLVSDKLESSLKFIDARMNELKFMKGEFHDLDKLIEVWRSCDQLGRVMYIDNFKSTKFNSLDQLKLDEIKSQFLNSLQRSDRAQEISELNRDPQYIWQSLVAAYQAEDRNTVTKIVSMLQRDFIHDDILLVAKGIVAKLDSDDVAAIQFWTDALSKVKDGKRKFCLEELLKVQLDRQDFGSALSSVEQLCQFSLLYMKTYAKLLKLLGNLDASTEVLGMYLGVYKEDMAASVLMAEQLYQLGRTSEADNQLNKVLAIDPGHPGALHYKKLWF